MLWCVVVRNLPCPHAPSIMILPLRVFLPSKSFSFRLFFAYTFTSALTSVATAATPPQSLSLQACIETAVANHHSRPASQFAVAIAEAQHRQALSAYWPQIALKGGLQRMDEAPDFVFPASMMGVPGQTITTPASTAYITVPAGVMGPTAMQLPVSVPAQTITTPAQGFPIPAQDVKLMDRDTTTAMVDAKWLLFDGGMRRGLNQQTDALIAAMKLEARRTDLEIVDSVQRMYFGAVLARQLHQVGRDTLERMESTLSLTETMYQGGGGKVTKADYLDNKVMVESIRALVASLEKNEAMAAAALANAIGLPWNASVVPSDTEIPFVPFNGDLEQLVGDAYRFNPDWNRFNAGIAAAEAAVSTARSGHYPKIALIGNLHRLWNDYDAGIVSDRNKTGWNVGVGVELPVFDGGLTRAKVAEMKSRLAKLHEQGFLLKEGIGLQVKDHFLGLAASAKACDATFAAMKASEENRDLNIRAYQQQLIETEKVIRAQLMEALMTAQHLKARYDHAALRSSLDLIVGTEVMRQLRPQP